jgi:hypothetical protein
MAETLTIPAGATRRDPLIPVGHPDFVWRPGADVQATWHRYTGWVPPSANRTQSQDLRPEHELAGRARA